MNSVKNKTHTRLAIPCLQVPIKHTTQESCSIPASAIAVTSSPPRSSSSSSIAFTSSITDGSSSSILLFYVRILRFTTFSPSPFAAPMRLSA